MPKMKSKGAVKKRFRVSKNGKVRCSRPARGHLHAPFGGDVRRRLRQQIQLSHTWGVLMKRMMGA